MCAALTFCAVSFNTMLSLFICQRGSEDQFLQFFDLLKNNAPDFLDTLRQRTDGTIFIPSNDAFYTVDQKR